MRKTSIIFAVFCVLSSPVFAQTGTDLAQSEQKALDSAQWFKTHFPEAMSTMTDGARLMQHSIEEQSIPSTEHTPNANTEPVAE